MDHVAAFLEPFAHFFAPLIAIACIVLGALLARRVSVRLMRVVSRRAHLSETVTRPLRRFVSFLIFVVALLLITGVLGYNPAGLWGTLGTVATIIGVGFLAVWSVLSNLRCTLLILITRPFKIGDELEFPGEPVKGRVVDLNFMHTTLETGSGSRFKIPNNLLFQKALHVREGIAPVSLEEQLRREEPAALGSMRG